MTTTLGAVTPAAGIVSIALRKVVIMNDPNLTFTSDRIIRKFSTSFTTALAGRTVEFYLLNSAGMVKYASGLKAADVAGQVDFALSDLSLIANNGDYPGIWSSAAAGTDGIFSKDNQGNAAIGSILLNSLSAQLVVGQTYTAATSGYTAATRYLPSIAIVHSPKAALVATDWANKPGGPVFTDPVTGNLPAGLNPTNTPLAQALTVPPAPVAPLVSQVGRVTAAFGDSIFAGGQHRDSSGNLDHNGYVQQTATYFGWNEHNFAVPGSSIKAWNIDQNGIRTAGLAMSPAPTLIRIGYTHNDSPVALGVITDVWSASGNAQDTIYGNYNKMILDLQAAYPGATIVLESSVDPYPLYPDTTHGPAQWNKFAQIDDAKRQIALAKGCLYLPMRDFVPKPPFLANFQDDGLHPNNLLHDILYRIAQQFYRQV